MTAPPTCTPYARTFLKTYFDAPTEEKNHYERVTPAQKECTKAHVSSIRACSSEVIGIQLDPQVHLKLNAFIEWSTEERRQTLHCLKK